jgi:DNA-binding NtrC family response regulator
MSYKRILIVDDEESVLTILKHSLKKLGPDCEVLTANNGFAALDELQTQKFDLVVTDYNMEQINGLELIEAINHLQPTARVIMITAYGSDALEAEARRLRVYHYFTKPLEINDFRQVVREALSKPANNRPNLSS